MDKKNKVRKIERNINIDLLRGIATLFMVGSHVTWFISDRTNIVWEIARILADIGCFTTFLIIFSYLNFASKKVKISRSFSLLAWYYVIAFTMAFSELTLSKVFEILFFIEVPGFTEYLLALVIFQIGIDLYRKTKFSVLKKGLLAALAITSFSLPITLYSLEIKVLSLNSRILNSISALFLGGEGVLRFPILYYLPFAIIGYLYLKNNWFNLQADKLKSFLVTNYSILLYSILGLFFLSLIDSDLAVFERWSPSPLFLILSYSVFIIFITISYILSTHRRHLPNPIAAIIAFIGRSTLPILIGHLAILQIYRVNFDQKTNNFLLLFFYFIMCIIIPLTFQLALRKKSLLFRYFKG